MSSHGRFILAEEDNLLVVCKSLEEKIALYYSQLNSFNNTVNNLTCSPF